MLLVRVPEVRRGLHVEHGQTVNLLLAEPLCLIEGAQFIDDPLRGLDAVELVVVAQRDAQWYPCGGQGLDITIPLRGEM